MKENIDDGVLLLIRHSAVSIEKQKPANSWHLSTEGRERCSYFAPLIAPYQPAIIITSEENKAVETGSLLASALGVRTKSSQNLHEHDRRDAPFFANPLEFHDAVGRIFTHPEELVFGRETGAQASLRINDAISQLITLYGDRSLAIVTHGTVMTLFINRYNPTLDPFPFWKSLQMPSAALLRLPNLALQTLILPEST